MTSVLAGLGDSVLIVVDDGSTDRTHAELHAAEAAGYKFEHVDAGTNRGYGGALRLVGVEFIVLSSVWQAKHPTGGTPALEGDLLNYVGAPNRYGLPAFYELHVWAWEHNPRGSFADWNTAVSCDFQGDRQSSDN